MLLQASFGNPLFAYHKISSACDDYDRMPDDYDCMPAECNGNSYDLQLKTITKGVGARCFPCQLFHVQLKLHAYTTLTYLHRTT